MGYIIKGEISMFGVQQYDYIEAQDTFVPVGLKLLFPTLKQARNIAVKAWNKKGNYYRITSTEDENFELWADCVAK